MPKYENLEEYHLTKNEHNTPEETSPAIKFLRTMVESRPGGEHRPQQEHAVREIERAISDGEHLIIEAGTGTGKSYATAIPAILSKERVVYSTATKSLSEQLINEDMPVLQQEIRKQTGEGFSVKLLKGRDNYACKHKLDILMSADKARPDAGAMSLFSDEEIKVEEVPTPVLPKKKLSKKEAAIEKSRSQQTAEDYKNLYKWVATTQSGDRSEAPAVSEDAWKGISSTNTECAGRKACPFGDVCFAEMARDSAKAAQVVVTNHAITALEIEDPMSSLLGERSIFIIDELHELDDYVSSAWGTTLSAKGIADALIVAKKYVPSVTSQKSYETTMLNLVELLDKFGGEIEDIEDGLFSENILPSKLEEILTEMLENVERLMLIFASSQEDELKNQLKKVFGSLNSSLSLFLVNSQENVRWAKNEAMAKNSFSDFKSTKEPAPATLHCAPLRIGPRLMEAFDSKNARMIGTSATIKVSGKFDSPIHELSLDEPLRDNKPHIPFAAVDVGTPFDFSKQAMLYVPDHETFPSAEYKSRDEHKVAVEEYANKMITAIGGRTLVLLTTTRRIKEVGDYLIENLPEGINVFKQGDMPPAQIIKAFIEDETSVLVATMGMWHGLNATGTTCSLVIMDKIPFPPVGDPLATSRQNYATSQGRNGFMDVYVAKANVKLSQGFGRLIRTMSDKGVVAVFDTRLHTKAYGRAMLKSFPNGVHTFTKLDVVLGALTRLREGIENNK